MYSLRQRPNAQAEARATRYNTTPAQKRALWPVASSAWLGEPLLLMLSCFINLAAVLDEMHSNRWRFSPAKGVEDTIIPNTQLEHASPQTRQRFWRDNVKVFRKPAEPVQHPLGERFRQTS